MRIAYFDCFAGASGDMILGALLDAGMPQEDLRQQLKSLNLPAFELHIKKVIKRGINATKVSVLVADQASERRLPEIETLVNESSLPVPTRQKAVNIFHRLGEVEAEIHGKTVEKIHLHELGGLDAIVDVVGALIGLESLGVERLYASPLPLARGFTRSAHGPLPLPAPATVALLEGVLVVGSDLDVELVTPTGAVLLTSLADSFGPIPAMRLSAVGYGAGDWDLPIPNVLRLLVGEQAPTEAAITETLVSLETNLDDLNPQIYEYVMDRLFAAGALDVYMASVQMKKNRPGTLLSVLCHPGDAEALMAVLFAETSTLGVRQNLVERRALVRSIETIDTHYGPVRVKVARWGQGQIKWAPEYEDCRRLAKEKEVPLLEVYRTVERIVAGKLISN